jgi:hypothetical protein
MSVAATTATNVVLMEQMAIRKIVQHLEKAEAIEAGRAIALPPKAPRSTVRRLVKDKILVPVGDDRFYLDSAAHEQAQARVSRAWRIVAIAGLIGLVVLVVMALLGSTLAR